MCQVTVAGFSAARAGRSQSRGSATPRGLSMSSNPHEIVSQSYEEDIAAVDFPVPCGSEGVRE